MIDVVNLQRKVKIELSAYRAFIKELVTAIPETTERTFSVAFIGDTRMRKLNELFRGKDSTTDVLSFPHEPDEFDVPGSPPYEGGGAAPSSFDGADGVVLSHSTDPMFAGTNVESHPTAKAAPLLRKEGSLNFLGDIVISAEQAERQANENDLTLENEIKQLILHGLLHLCGYDHEADTGEMNAQELELRDKLGI